MKEAQQSDTLEEPVVANDQGTSLFAVPCVFHAQDFIYKEDDSPEVLETAGVTVRVGCHASFLDSKTIQLTSGALTLH